MHDAPTWYDVQSLWKSKLIGVWQGINRIRWEEFKELYEMLATVNVEWDCSFKSLYIVSYIVWQLVGGTITCYSTGWKVSGEDSDGIDFGEAKE